MGESNSPRPYTQWRTDPIDRSEDAAYTFGSHLIEHCHKQAVAETGSGGLPTTIEDLNQVVTTAVDTALHSVMDLLEGFWKLPSGDAHTIEYALSVCVRDSSREMIERIDISPCMLDLPIGYWKWRSGEYR